MLFDLGAQLLEAHRPHRLAADALADGAALLRSEFRLQLRFLVGGERVAPVVVVRILAAVRFVRFSRDEAELFELLSNGRLRRPHLLRLLPSLDRPAPGRVTRT